MVVQFNRADGTQSTEDVQSFRLLVDGEPLVIRSTTTARQIIVESPGSERNWQQLILRMSAANLFALEILPHKRRDNDPLTRTD